MKQTEGNGTFFTAIAAVVAIIVLIIGIRTTRQATTPVEQDKPPKDELAEMLSDPDQVTIARSLLAQRAERDKSIWADEVQAQTYEGPFVDLWDQLRASTDPWSTLSKFQFHELHWSGFGSKANAGFGLSQSQLKGKQQTLTQSEFGEQLAKLKADGYRLVQSEWHHARFEPKTDKAPRSVFNVSLNISGPNQHHLSLKGQLAVEWADKLSDSGNPVAHSITVQNAKMLERTGKPAFEEVGLPLRQQIRTAMPVMAYDLNNDGLSEIIVPAHNLLLWNRGAFRFEAETLMEHLPAGLNLAGWAALASRYTAVIDEFTGDSLPDLVIVLPKHGAFLFEMNSEQRFASEPVQILAGTEELKWPKVVTSGDVNGDGKTDLWFGQYLSGMYNGAFPNPVFDATNGHPAYLLINQGDGKFTDATESSGLAQRRTRLTYSASLWDLDTDGDLDLVTVNDFSGVDAYHNDARGNFKDLKDGLVDERANFGMGHVVTDLNNDGIMDLYVTGMSSTTARRLESLGLGRKEFPDIQSLRMKMGYGSRLYYGDGKGRYLQAEAVDQVARTGWSWGIGAFDFGNDGWTDLYVANGHISRESCRDYCTRFWTHDIYTDPALPTPTKKFVFGEALEDAYGKGIVSWNGYEKNKLFINQGGTNYRSAAFQMGAAFEYDSRTVLSEDFDADGRVDLLIVEENANWTRTFDSRVRLYRNIWEQNGNWIGIQLGHGRGGSLMGSTITIETSNGKRVATLVNGDSFAGQHSPTKHFGLGNLTSIKRAVIRWPDGKETSLDQPAINSYHRVVQSD